MGLLAAAAIFTLISYTKMPDTEELENPNYEYATLILSDSNQELGKFFSKNREGVTHEELNAYLIKALVATEDERYYGCLLYTSPSPRDGLLSRMPSSA